MRGFIDETNIEVSSGNGGPGSISFRREKYVPRGGPDGGDGGKGGDVVFRVKKNLKTLSSLRYRRFFRAEDGKPGRGSKKHGRDGLDAVLEVPPGTIIKNSENGELIKDLTELTHDEEWIFLKGGKGGLGNSHFATSRKQTPHYAQPGLPGAERKLKVELNIIADIGFVGFPNAGKSSLLERLTNARPKIASYPFTTKIPNLGVYRLGDQDLVLADIPGIIEGASDGAGLGLRFLKHINRTRGLLFLIDLTDENYLDSFPVLLNELKSFSVELASRKRVIIGTKMDEEGTDEALEKLAEKYKEEEVIGISVFSGKGIDMFDKLFYSMLSGIEVIAKSAEISGENSSL
ncbi:MAG: GTPase ObgE [Spirochaetia bacterium]|nr:GTPase ObgE [Spirochaetia bacterium]